MIQTMNIIPSESSMQELSTDVILSLSTFVGTFTN